MASSGQFAGPDASQRMPDALLAMPALIQNSGKGVVVRGVWSRCLSPCTESNSMSRMRSANLADSYDLYVDLRESVSLKYFLLVYLLLSLLVLTAVLFALLLFVLFIRHREPELGKRMI